MPPSCPTHGPTPPVHSPQPLARHGQGWGQVHGGSGPLAPSPSPTALTLHRDQPRDSRPPAPRHARQSAPACAKPSTPTRPRGEPALAGRPLLHAWVSPEPLLTPCPTCASADPRVHPRHVPPAWRLADPPDHLPPRAPTSHARQGPVPGSPGEQGVGGSPLPGRGSPQHPAWQHRLGAGPATPHASRSQHVLVPSRCQGPRGVGAGGCTLRPPGTPGRQCRLGPLPVWPSGHDSYLCRLAARAPLWAVAGPCGAVA